MSIRINLFKMAFKTGLNHQNLYKSYISSDVQFILMDRNGVLQRIPAHKLMLRTRSKVFERMFFGELKEADVVEIPDVSAEGFCEFLQYFYFAELELSVMNLPEVFRLADKYDTAPLRQYCAQYMDETTDPDVMCVYYELTCFYEVPTKLVKKLENLIARNFDEAVKWGVAEGGFTKTSLANLLQSESFMHKEINIFNNVVAWAETSLRDQNVTVNTENIEKEMRGLVKLIRFPTMSLPEFLNCVRRCPNLLSREEYFDIQFYILTERSLTSAKCFSTIVRQDIDVVVRYEPYPHSYVAYIDHFYMVMNTTKKYFIKMDLSAKTVLNCKIYEGYKRDEPDYLFDVIYDEKFEKKNDKFALSAPVTFEAFKRYTLELKLKFATPASFCLKKVQKGELTYRKPFKITSPYCGSVMTQLVFTEVLD